MGYLLLIPACVVWFVAVPPLALVLWLLARPLFAILPTFGGTAECPPWLETPWDVVVHAATLGFGVKVCDADGEHSLVLPGVRTLRCAVLANHRSWADFFIDPAQGHCAVVARTAAVAAGGVAGLLGLASRRVIRISRGVDSRHTISAKCEAHERFLMYPEGTRRASAADAHEPSALKVGGLKNLYEAGRPALVAISVNKERVINERSGAVGCGVTLYRARSPLLRPADHPTFEGFLEAVEAAWVAAWRRAYALRDEHEPPGRGAGSPSPSLAGSDSGTALL